jgi:hypothetical protein
MERETYDQLRYAERANVVARGHMTVELGDVRSAFTPTSPFHSTLSIPHHRVTATHHSPHSLLPYLRDLLGSAHLGTCRSRLPLLDWEARFPLVR